MPISLFFSIRNCSADITKCSKVHLNRPFVVDYDGQCWPGWKSAASRCSPEPQPPHSGAEHSTHGPPGHTSRPRRQRMENIRGLLLSPLLRRGSNAYYSLSNISWENVTQLLCNFLRKQDMNLKQIKAFFLSFLSSCYYVCGFLELFAISLM